MAVFADCAVNSAIRVAAKLVRLIFPMTVEDSACLMNADQCPAQVLAEAWLTFSLGVGAGVWCIARSALLYWSMPAEAQISVRSDGSTLDCQE